MQWWTLSRVEAKAQENEERYWKDLETNVSQLRTLLSPNNTKEIHSEIKIHAEVQPMVSEVEAAFWKIARRVEWMKCVRSCLEQLVCDPSTSALYENLVKWRMASCLGKDSLYHAEERGPTTGQ